MFKSTQEFNAAIKMILVQVRDNGLPKNINPDLPNEDYDEALVECINRGYLSGISYQRTLGGKPRFDYNNIRLTYSGLAFIESQ